MGHKIKPISLRLGGVEKWKNRWFLKKSLKHFLQEDVLIRGIIRKKILNAGIDDIEIERTGAIVRIFIKAARPGLIIGRGGKGIEELKKQIVSSCLKWRRSRKIEQKPDMNINVEELRRGSVSANVTAQNIASDFERRLPFRKVIKRCLSSLMQNKKEVLGAKILVSGRLNGAEISRHELFSDGKMPLQTLRGKIDYGEATAFTTYGTNGIKVWIYKGEIFEEKEK